ncbi:hypothetical protein MMYC01_202410 [Madurella mycetomatis]|uniref:Uncharacterized protein n=1 Tax=Madurella mycetomatis TaxID=100816 RepID=A0A175W8T5_9PEZI|nr:hypothetical protein MMYC01_202410 [Madurella mycetomatis]
MPRIISRVLGTIFLLLGHIHGHMIMNTPVPYNLDIQPLLQVGPVSGGQYPFPCHNHYSFTSRTLVEAGSGTLVNFTSGAQHGGAKFKTIYTIIGGCPAVFTDEQHHLPIAGLDRNRREDGEHCGDDQGINCIRQFMIPIPNLWNGPATFAWTWSNKLGNKEMNCAPVNITVGTGDLKLIDDLPDIFVANYPDDPDAPNCVTGTLADKRNLIMEPALKPVNYFTQIPSALSPPTFQSDFRTVLDEMSSSASLFATSFPPLPSPLLNSTSTSVSSVGKIPSYSSKTHNQGNTTAALAASTSSKASPTRTMTVTVTARQSSPSSAAASATGSPNKESYGNTNSTTSETLVVIPISNFPNTRTKNTTTTTQFPACTPSHAHRKQAISG